ncbi:MAG: AAA family ATPase, partial [Balneola sp.]
MYLSNIKLWNFRKFGSQDFNLDSPNLDLDFQPGLNVLIGENDSGKTAIVDAIKLVLKTHSYEWIRYEFNDFFEDKNRFRIELLFKNLSDEEAKNFTEVLGWHEEKGNKFPYLRLILDVSRNEDRVLPSDVKAGVDDEGYQLSAESKEYLKATYLKPLRDAESELIAKRNSRISQILQGDDAFKNVGNEHILVFIFESLGKDLIDYFSGEYTYTETDDETGEETDVTPQEGKAIKNRIDDYVKSFFSKNYEVEFETVQNNLKSILEKISLTLFNDKNPGLGTLNRLFMAAELLHLDKPNWDGIRLGLIEELEAHLHPQAQMKVIERLNMIDKIQLILTTHSPNLASKVLLNDLIICKGSSAFPMGEDFTKLDKEDYKFLEKFLDTTKANLFFAEGVILVEGWAEEIIIPSIAKHIGLSLTEFGVSVVNVASTAFLRYSKIFQRQTDQDSPIIDVPVAVITDLDLKPGEATVKNEDGISAKDLTINAKKEKYNGQNDKTFVSPEWTLEYCLAKSPSLSKVYEKTLKSVHSGTNWDNVDESLTDKLDKKT